MLFIITFVINTFLHLVCSLPSVHTRQVIHIVNSKHNKVSCNQWIVNVCECRCCRMQGLSHWMAVSGGGGAPVVSRGTLLPGGHSGGHTPLPSRHIQPQSRTKPSRAVFTVLSWWEQCPCFTYTFGSFNSIGVVLCLSYPPIILRNVLWGLGTSWTYWSLPGWVFLPRRYVWLHRHLALSSFCLIGLWRLSTCGSCDFCRHKLQESWCEY